MTNPTEKVAVEQANALLASRGRFPSGGAVPFDVARDLIAAVLRTEPTGVERAREEISPREAAIRARRFGSCDKCGSACGHDYALGGVFCTNPKCAALSASPSAESAQEPQQENEQCSIGVSTASMSSTSAAVKIPTSREIMLAGGVDPDGPFEVGPFPAEMRHKPEASAESGAGDGGKTRHD